MNPADVDADDVAEALVAIRHGIGDFEPEVMVQLGSGLAEAMTRADIYSAIAYDKIPGLAVPTVAGHPGRLLVGNWGNRRVLIFQGRLHFYEGHSWSRVTLPVRIAAAMGVSACVFTNSSGGINPKLKPGSLVVIDDHLNFMGSNALVGVTSHDPSSQFPDMCEAYSKRLRRLLDESAAILAIPLFHGVYVGVSGPSYETPAEIRAFALLGADVIGMSTVGEVLMARRAKLECCAISCVSNHAAGVSNRPIRHQDVLDAGKAVAQQLGALIDTFLRRL